MCGFKHCELLNHIDTALGPSFSFSTPVFLFPFPCSYMHPSLLVSVHHIFLSLILHWSVMQTNMFPSQKMLIIPQASNIHKICRLPFHYSLYITKQVFLTAFHKLNNFVYRLEYCETTKHD